MWVRLDTPDRIVRAIDFRHGIPGVPSYCLPSMAAFDQAGRLLLGDQVPAALGEERLRFALTRFKMLVAGGADERYLDRRNHQVFTEHVINATKMSEYCSAEAITTVFLAYAMRRVRRELQVRIGRSDVDVSFNTCVPIDQRENNRVFAAFQRVVAAAEQVERSAPDSESARTWLDRALAALDGAPLADAERRVFLVPEAVAGTAAYVSSLQRESGIHALVDIGAGTTDVSIFNLVLSKREGATSLWYAARSVPYGAGHIEARARHELRSAGHDTSGDSVFRALAGSTQSLPLLGSLLSAELDKMKRATHPAWAEAYSGKSKSESAWKRDAVKVFIAGGGAMLSNVTTVFGQSWVEKWGPYPCTRLPNPEDYDPSTVGGPFVRVSVAYGLTIPIPVLGSWVMPAETPNQTPAPLPVRSHEQDGDQLLPRYGW